MSVCWHSNAVLGRKVQHQTGLIWSAFSWTLKILCYHLIQKEKGVPQVFLPQPHSRFKEKIVCVGTLLWGTWPQALSTKQSLNFTTRNRFEMFNVTDAVSNAQIVIIKHSNCTCRQTHLLARRMCRLRCFSLMYLTRIIAAGHQTIHVAEFVQHISL